MADQTDAAISSRPDRSRIPSIIGTEFSRERVSIDSYNGLTSEAIGAGAFNGSGSLLSVSVFDPPNLTPFNSTPTLTGVPTVVTVGTQSAYAMETANFQDSSS